MPPQKQSHVTNSGHSWRFERLFRTLNVSRTLTINKINVICL